MVEPSSRPMSIEGPFCDERTRLDGMTDADRAWRKQWLKDQELSPNEPRHIPESRKHNPIRLAMRFPLDWAFSKLEPKLVTNVAYVVILLYQFKFRLG